MPPVGFEPTISVGERPQTTLYDISDLRVKVCKSVLYRTIQINNQLYITIFQFYYPDVYLLYNKLENSCI
jgi:hypothetical protein